MASNRALAAVRILGIFLLLLAGLVSTVAAADRYDEARRRMVDEQIRKRGITDPRVIAALSKVPRHLFVPEPRRPAAYGDTPLPIGHGQTISQPYIVARMTELLELTAASRVLEIGAGSGYQTVILACLARNVYAIERVPQLTSEAQARLQQLKIHNVSLRCSDGTLGWDVYAPFDAILVAAGSPEIPAPLLQQLKIGGRLVLPVGQDQQTQRLVRVTRAETNFQTEDFGACAFVPLIGEHGWK